MLEAYAYPIQVVLVSRRLCQEVVGFVIISFALRGLWVNYLTHHFILNFIYVDVTQAPEP